MARTMKSAQPPTRAATMPWLLDGSSRFQWEKKHLYIALEESPVRQLIIELFTFFLQNNLKLDLLG